MKAARRGENEVTMHLTERMPSDVRHDLELRHIHVARTEDSGSFSYVLSFH